MKVNRELIELVRIEDLSQTPSLNKYLRMHWTARRRLKERYGWELVAAGAHDPKYAAREEYRLVRFMSFRKELLDYDNLVGGCKPLVDAMVDTGLLADDSPKYASFLYFQKADRENPRTEARIFILKRR